MTEETKSGEAKGEEKPGSFDTSEATNVTTTLEEANEVGYLGATFDDEDYTVAGVTGESQETETQQQPPQPPPQPLKDEPQEQPTQPPQPAQPQRPSEQPQPAGKKAKGDK